MSSASYGICGGLLAPRASRLALRHEEASGGMVAHELEPFLEKQRERPLAFELGRQTARAPVRLEQSPPLDCAQIGVRGQNGTSSSVTSSTTSSPSAIVRSTVHRSDGLPTFMNGPSRSSSASVHTPAVAAFASENVVRPATIVRLTRYGPTMYSRPPSIPS